MDRSNFYLKKFMESQDPIEQQFYLDRMAEEQQRFSQTPNFNYPVTNANYANSAHLGPGALIVFGLLLLVPVLFFVYSIILNTHPEVRSVDDFIELVEVSFKDTVNGTQTKTEAQKRYELQNNNSTTPSSQDPLAH
ncbi:hypothetical protein [Ligilactobacillus faecis]|uniref:hypothetical protein n=1 Tax=Ligilactobacillus faecis TaxID=762833 RepID=UPI002469A4D7|nr:hypothetical protein [Ligilactobacillus faecis]WGN88643.1 hypothetical protein QFX10_06035 [Ligilactobacillus faecis]